MTRVATRAVENSSQTLNKGGRCRGCYAGADCGNGVGTVDGDDDDGGMGSFLLATKLGGASHIPSFSLPYSSFAPFPCNDDSESWNLGVSKMSRTNLS